MTTQNTPKSQFNFTAQYFDGSTEEILVELATPANTNDFQGMKGIELYSEFGELIQQDSQALHL